MIYLPPHIRALEAQIAYLKERLEKAEREKSDVEQEKRKAEEAARAREDTLLERIAKLAAEACQRGDALLDRLLVKNNVAPVAEPLTPAPPSVELVTPYSGMGPEYEQAHKESYLREEVAWLMREDPTVDEGTAYAIAEQNYIIKYQVIK